MDYTTINSLKSLSGVAQATYEAEKARLAALGYKSVARYEMLKDLKAAADAEYAAYRSCAHKEIKAELNKIIRADRPNREAGARGRSAWKQAKFLAKSSGV